MSCLGGEREDAPGDRENPRSEPEQREDAPGLARHKLECKNLTHAVGVAVAAGIIPAELVGE